METIYNSTNLNLTSEWNGKGRHFTSRFLEAGIVSYGKNHVYLITKETIDKFVQTMVGCPVIIKHADVNDANVKDLSVGNISKVWFDDKDGWFYCEGVLTDKEAVRLVEQGQSVSCGYRVLDKDLSGGIWHDIPYNAEILNGDFEHLAIVDNPRYRDANILLNSSGVNDMNLKKLFNSKVKNSNEKENEMTKCSNKSDLRKILNEIKDGKRELDDDLINSLCEEDAETADDKDAGKAKDDEVKNEGEKEDVKSEKEPEKKDDVEVKAEKDKEEKPVEKEEKDAKEPDEKPAEKDDEKKGEKAENSSDFDKLEDLKNSVYEVQAPKVYMTEAERLDLGKNY